MKYDWKFKLQCVEDYKKGIWTKKPDYAKCSDHDFHHKITDWAKTFDLYGVDGLKHKQINKTICFFYDIMQQRSGKVSKTKKIIIGMILSGILLGCLVFGGFYHYKLTKILTVPKASTVLTITFLTCSFTDSIVKAFSPFNPGHSFTQRPHPTQLSGET